MQNSRLERVNHHWHGSLHEKGDLEGQLIQHLLSTGIYLPGNPS